MTLCPSCKTELPNDAVLCVGCGFHLADGVHLAAAASDDRPHPESPANDDNPYRSPTDAAGGPLRESRLRENYDNDTRVEYLEQRVRELERRVDATRLLSPGFFARMFVVCGYAVLGYICVVLCGTISMALFRAIF